jgi:hypothetical protein
MFVNPMIRIQMNELDGQLILQVEGRLAGAFELELLKDCWQGAYSKHPDRKISVDLKSVTCIDRPGVVCSSLCMATESALSEPAWPLRTFSNRLWSGGLQAREWAIASKALHV